MTNKSIKRRSLKFRISFFFELQMLHIDSISTLLNTEDMEVVDMTLAGSDFQQVHQTHISDLPPLKRADTSPQRVDANQNVVHGKCFVKLLRGKQKPYININVCDYKGSLHERGA